MAEKDERFLLFVDSAIFVLDFLSVEDLLILSTVSPTLHSFLDEPSRCILWRRSLELEPLLISAESVSFASNRYDSTRIMRSFHRTSLSQNLDYLLSNIERYSFSKGIFTVAINRLRIISNDDFARANLIRTGVHEFICLQVHDCGDETKVISGLTLLAELMRPLPTHISANSIFNSISVDLSSWVLDLIRNCTNSTPHKTQVLLYAIRCGINLSLQPKQLAFMRKVKAHLLVAESIRHLIYCSDMFISVLIFAVYLMGNVIDTVNVIELEFEVNKEKSHVLSHMLITTL